MNKLFLTIGGRRFFLTCVTQVVSVWLLWYEKLTPEAYAAIIIASVAAYITGNTMQKNQSQPTEYLGRNETW